MPWALRRRRRPKSWPRAGRRRSFFAPCLCIAKLFVEQTGSQGYHYRGNAVCFTDATPGGLSWGLRDGGSMQIIKADVLGMCFGVRDALAVMESLDRPESITIHGELVHN